MLAKELRRKARWLIVVVTLVAIVTMAAANGMAAPTSFVVDSQSETEANYSTTHGLDAVSTAESDAPEIAARFSCASQVVPPTITADGEIQSTPRVSVDECGGCTSNPFACLDDSCPFGQVCITLTSSDCFFGIGGPFECGCSQTDSPLRSVVNLDSGHSPILVAAVLISAGCLAPSSAGPSIDESDCVPRTNNWDARCPELFLQDYFLNFENVAFELDDDERASLSFSLRAWALKDVTVTALDGYAGFQNGTDQSLDFSSVRLPLKIKAGSTADITVLSPSAVILNQSYFYYGVQLNYTHGEDATWPHRLVAFSRCYELVEGELAFMTTVKGPSGETLDCISKDYLAHGMVSDVTVIIHDYRDSKHAFPGAEVKSFWGSLGL